MSGSIEGQVLNQRDGQPIAGASLKLAGDGVEKQESSGNNGNYAFADLATGQYELTVTKEGFEDGIYGPLVVVDGTPTQIVVALQPKNL